MPQIDKCHKITVADMAPHIHSFLPNENKVNKIAQWLINWIKKSLDEGKIKPNDYLPSKGELAFHIGVSIGTMQSVFRIVEDMGLIESKQKIGTYIKDTNEAQIEKLVSKREVTKEIIKKYIINNNYKEGDVLVSIRKLAEQINVPASTIRITLNNLSMEGILAKEKNAYVVKNVKYKIQKKEQKTLVEKTAESINEYIKKNIKFGQKLPSNNALADMLKVSVKTIHDAIKILSDAGVVKTKRGYYGTVVVNQNDNNDNDNELYFYEQVEQSIRAYIVDNCKINDKLLSIKNFSEVFNVSAKTIKKALDNLADEGCVIFVRGRRGGTFVTNIPSVSNQGYTWLALSPEFEQKN